MVGVVGSSPIAPTNKSDLLEAVAEESGKARHWRAHGRRVILWWSIFGRFLPIWAVSTPFSQSAGSLVTQRARQRPLDWTMLSRGTQTTSPPANMLESERPAIAGLRMSGRVTRLSQPYRGERAAVSTPAAAIPSGSSVNRRTTGGT